MHSCVMLLCQYKNISLLMNTVLLHVFVYCYVVEPDHLEFLLLCCFRLYIIESYPFEAPCASKLCLYVVESYPFEAPCASKLCVYVVES